MRSSNRLRVVSAAALGAALCLGCYETTALRLQVKSASRSTNCEATADRVFAEAGFERAGTLTGRVIFYTPRMTASSFVALRWGIGASLNPEGQDATCEVVLEALSEDLSAPPDKWHASQPGEYFESTETSRSKLYTSQRGDYYDSTVREMAKRLEVAFAARQ
jgi:hypothetical protein